MQVCRRHSYFLVVCRRLRHQQWLIKQACYTAGVVAFLLLSLQLERDAEKTVAFVILLLVTSLLSAVLS